MVLNGNFQDFFLGGGGGSDKNSWVGRDQLLVHYSSSSSSSYYYYLYCVAFCLMVQCKELNSKYCCIALSTAICYL